jgi:hypothetical protein
MRRNHVLTVVVGEGVRGGGGGGVRRAAVACGIGERCGGGAALFCDKTLRGEMKRYVKDMSGHKFAERGVDVLQIYGFVTNIHIIGLKIGLTA